MQFTKMHGIGNDYVYVDCFTQPTPADPAAMAVKIADRHTGVGGDGLILICPSQVADARMRMFNADGSEAEMCGNGVRCVAKYVYDHVIAKKPTLKIETGRGVLAIDLEIANGKAQRARVDMGEPILEAAKIPVILDNEGAMATARSGHAERNPMPTPSRGHGTHEQIVEHKLPPFTDRVPGWFERAGIQLQMTCVSMGNPHVIIYCGNVRPVPLAEVGPIIEHFSIFPKRINVHFVQVHSPQEVTMRTWERGSGITLACGTGAIRAVCVAGVLAGKTSRKILAHLPGGDLELEWNETDNHVYMTGPATEVFSGDWPE